MYEWKVVSVYKSNQDASWTDSLTVELNGLEKEGFEVYKISNMEGESDAIILARRRVPAKQSKK